MLVLGRKVGETIRINDDVIISIERIRGDRVQVGIDAPKEVAVHRGEVWEEINKEKRQELR